MPLELTATCLICGAVRQKTNRWWIGRCKGQFLSIHSYTLAGAQKGGDILCGEVCLHKWVAQGLTSLAEKEKVSEESAVRSFLDS